MNKCLSHDLTFSTWPDTTVVLISIRASEKPGVVILTCTGIVRGVVINNSNGTFRGCSTSFLINVSTNSVPRLSAEQAVKEHISKHSYSWLQFTAQDVYHRLSHTQERASKKNLTLTILVIIDFKLISVVGKNNGLIIPSIVCHISLGKEFYSLVCGCNSKTSASPLNSMTLSSTSV